MGSLERAMGIEPTSEAWEASILPLYDARFNVQQPDYTQQKDVAYRAGTSCSRTKWSLD
jgi:hypothetical protein